MEQLGFKTPKELLVYALNNEKTSHLGNIDEILKEINKLSLIEILSTVSSFFNNILDMIDFDLLISRFDSDEKINCLKKNVKKIPESDIKTLDIIDANTLVDKCGICMYVLNKDRYVHECGGMFHIKCLTNKIIQPYGRHMRKSRNKCPNCRKEIDNFGKYKNKNGLYVPNKEITTHHSICYTCKEEYDLRINVMYGDLCKVKVGDINSRKWKETQLFRDGKNCIPCSNNLQFCGCQEDSYSIKDSDYECLLEISDCTQNCIHYGRSTDVDSLDCDHTNNFEYGNKAFIDKSLERCEDKMCIGCSSCIDYFILCYCECHKDYLDIKYLHTEEICDCRCHEKFKCQCEEQCECRLEENCKYLCVCRATAKCAKCENSCKCGLDQCKCGCICKCNKYRDSDSEPDGECYCEQKIGKISDSLPIRISVIDIN